MSGKGKRGKYEKPLHIAMPFNEALDRFAHTDPKELETPDEGKDGPVSLVEYGDTGDRFLVYEGTGGAQVELRVDGDTFWASQQQMADAFGVTRPNITQHLQNVFKEGELNETAVCKETLLTASDGKQYATKMYDLNALISVGYRIGGKSGTQFRVWATDKLLRYLTKGFVVDSARLREPGNQDRVAELRETIRDIRASEANVYAELRRICAMCKDYDPRSKDAHTFYARMQAKLYYAVVTHTPAEVLKDRADAREPNMGLQSWKKVEIVQTDATVAKNYLGPTELQELNRLTTILLDIFDDQLKIGKLTLMSEATKLLDVQLRNLNRQVLTHGGTVQHEAAEAHAKAEYKKFDEHRRIERADRAQKELAELKALDGKLPKVFGSRKGG